MGSGRFGLLGLPDPHVELFTEDPCRLAPFSLVSSGLDDDTTVLCFATLLQLDSALRLGSGIAACWSDRSRSPSRDGTPERLTRIEFAADPGLGVTLVYGVVSNSDRRSQDAATTALLRLMAVFGAEEIADDPALLSVVP